MSEIRPIPPFKRFCGMLGAFPEAFSDAMSVYESLEWLYHYISTEIVPKTNEAIKLAEELKEYVEHYFDNLDVQEEINNKLDEMAESGQLAEIITAYLQVKSVLAFDNVEDMKAATNLMDGSFVQTYGFYAKNDGGGAKYKVREVTNLDDVDEKKLIALLDTDLVAELITDSLINVKQIGAHGDGENDDTEYIEYAIDNWNAVYVPSGNYVVSDQMNLKDGLHLYGDGETSALVISYTYNEEVEYLFTHTNEFLENVVIENLKFTTSSETNYCGAIKINGALRGNSIKNVWFFKISNPIYLGNKVWGGFDLENVFIYYFPNVTVDTTIGVGIYAEGNTIFGRNIEVLGRYGKGIYLNGVSVANFTNCNVSGSEEIEMLNAFTIEDSSYVNLDTIWIEKTHDENGNNNTKSINVTNSHTISLSNINCSNGSIYIDKSLNVKLKNIEYGNADAGLRFSRGSEIVSDLSGCGRCNYQAINEYSTGNVILPDENESSLNVVNNSILLVGVSTPFSRTNDSLVTVTDNTSTYYSGDKSITVSASNYQGIQYTLPYAEVGKTYTVMALIKTTSNVSNVYFTATNASHSTKYPNKVGRWEDGWQVVKATFTVTDSNPVFKLICNAVDTSSNGVFLIDSLSLYEGFHNASFPMVTDKIPYVKYNRLYSAYSPAEGTWQKGDIVWNNFASNDTVFYWKYNGSSWVGVNI